MTKTLNVTRFLAAFDAMVDDTCTSGAKFDMAHIIPQFNLTRNEIKAVKEATEKATAEWEAVVLELDEQIVEGYSNIAKPARRQVLEMYYQVQEYSTNKGNEPEIETMCVKGKDIAVFSGPVGTVVSFIPKWKAVQIWTDARISGDRVECSGKAFLIRLTTKITFDACETSTAAELQEVITSLESRVQADVKVSNKLSKKQERTMFIPN